MHSPDEIELTEAELEALADGGDPPCVYLYEPEDLIAHLAGALLRAQRDLWELEQGESL